MKSECQFHVKSLILCSRHLSERLIVFCSDQPKGSSSLTYMTGSYIYINWTRRLTKISHMLIQSLKKEKKEGKRNCIIQYGCMDLHQNNNLEIARVAHQWHDHRMKSCEIKTMIYTYLSMNRCNISRWTIVSMSLKIIICFYNQHREKKCLIKINLPLMF